jgi:hypothetical protein
MVLSILITILSILIMVLFILIMVLSILIMVLSILSELKLIPVGRIQKLRSPSYSRHCLSFIESKDSWQCLEEMSNVIMALESFCKFMSLAYVHPCSLWSSIFHIVVFQEVSLQQFCMYFLFLPLIQMSALKIWGELFKSLYSWLYNFLDLQARHCTL